MNILYSVLVGGWGGLEQYPLTLYDRLKQKKHRVFILTIKNSELHKRCILKKIPVFTVDKFSRFNLKIIKQMRHIVKENNIHIVHSQKTGEIYNWYFALRGLKNVKYFLTFHLGVTNKQDILHKIIYKRVNKAIAISGYFLEKMKKNIPLKRNKMVLIYNGVDLSRFNYKIAKSDFRKTSKIPSRALLLTAVGNLSPAKGTEDILKAFAMICKKHDNIYCIWVGEDKYSSVFEHKKKLEIMIKNNNLTSRFILAGYRNDIPSILKASDIFVLPSHNEAFGLVYIEAMAMKLPVIGCNRAGAKEVIQNKINGFTVEPENPQQLAGVIEKYIKNKKLIALHGKESLKRSKLFSMNKHIDKLLKIYSI